MNAYAAAFIALQVCRLDMTAIPHRFVLADLGPLYARPALIAGIEEIQRTEGLPCVKILSLRAGTIYVLGPSERIRALVEEAEAR